MFKTPGPTDALLSEAIIAMNEMSPASCDECGNTNQGSHDEKCQIGIAVAWAEDSVYHIS